MKKMKTKGIAMILAVIMIVSSVSIYKTEETQAAGK